MSTGLENVDREGNGKEVPIVSSDPSVEVEPQVGARPTVSVCMATYNGSLYVKDQLKSILDELAADDEIVIYDDASQDSTLEEISTIHDSRIRVIASKNNLGHVRAFEQALKHARGDYIFLSDQDDLWIPGRRALLLQALQDHNFAASNWEPFGSDVLPTRVLLPDNNRAPLNIARIFLGSMPYFGCAMGATREGLALALPFPATVEAHDLWLGIIGNLSGGFAHVAEVTVARRIHATNLTPFNRRPLKAVVVSRVTLARLLVIGISRYIKSNTGKSQLL